MSCTFNYVEDALRKSSPEEADRLNEKGIETWREIKNSKLFTLNKNEEYSFSREGTKQRSRQDSFIAKLNDENEFIFNEDNEVNIDLLKLTDKILDEEINDNDISVDDKYNLGNLIDDENSLPLFSDDVIYYNLDDKTSTSVLFGENQQYTVHNANDVINNILDSFGEEFSKDAKTLLERAEVLLKKSQATVRIVSADNFSGEKHLMRYDAKTNEILVRDDSDKYSVNDMVESFLHEATHSVTVRAYIDPKTFEEKDFVKFINKSFVEFKKYATDDERKRYGFYDELEFIAELFTNPSFERTLRRIESRVTESDSVNKVISSFFSELNEFIRRLFGAKKTKVVDALIESITRIASSEQSEYKTDERFFLNKLKDNVEDEENVDEELKFIKPTLVSFEDRLLNLIGKAKDNIAQVRAITAASKGTASKREHRVHLENLDKLIEEMDELSELEKLKVIVQYTKAMAKTIMQVRKGVDKLNKSSKNKNVSSNLSLIQKYEDYIASYDLISDIRDTIAVSSRIKLSTEDKESVQKIKDILSSITSDHSNLIAEFKVLKREESIRFLASPENNTQVETDYKKRLYKEYVDLKITGESKEEYATRMLNTRDKDVYKADLLTAAEKIASDPAFDISSFTKNFGDALNTNSKLSQIVVNIFSSVRDKIISKYRNVQVNLNDLFDDLIKEKGNIPPSQMYKNIYEKDNKGNFFFKGRYKIEFRDKYIDEYLPLRDAASDILAEFMKNGMDKKEARSQDKFKDADKLAKAWMAKHTRSEKGDLSGKMWLPNKEYLNEPVTGIDSRILKEAIAVAKLSHKATHGKQSLIKRTGQIEFFQFPSITKSPFERTMEADFKGSLQDIKDNFTKIRPDDIGFGEAVDSKGETLKSVKIHYRGKLDENQQSLDVMTLIRSEHLNAISYREKKDAESSLLLIADISRNKQYFQMSKKTGLPLVNIFNKNVPSVTIPGELSNEYSRIKGMIERNIYDTMSVHGGTFLGADVNKLTNFVNGTAASIAMSFNIASGTANVLNGFTQLLIEAGGGNLFKINNLLKAEAKYTQDLPNIIKDMSNPIKKSFTNQVLEMYDVFGGFDPSTQEFIRNSIAKKIASRKSMNGLNEMGEHAMNAVVTMSVLDSLKVMNKEFKHIDKDGNVVSEEKAASLLDMLKMDSDGKLFMDNKVKFTKHNLTLEYSKGGKTHVNLLIKNKVFDLFGVYDPAFKNEISKHWLGKSVMMFKNYFLSGMNYRYTGISSALKKKEDLTEDELNYSSAQKEYMEGIYTTFIRFIPALKGLQLMYAKDVYNGLTDYEKSNLKKATIEIMLTAVLLPAIGNLLMMAGGNNEDDDALWFAIYEFRRLESELSQFRNPIEATKLISNPVAGVRFIQNGISFIYELATPINFMPNEKENIISYLDEDAKGHNKLFKKGKKIAPILTQFGEDSFFKDYKKLNSLIDK